jgi:predicted nucleic acid-binding protein
MDQLFTHLNKLVLLDNTILSNFALVSRTDLVTGIWQNCTTTPDAWGEFLTGIALNKLPAGVWAGLPITVLLPEEREFWQQLPPMGSGEGSCLAVAYHRQAILATDDQKARRIGIRWGLEMTGTVGFLLYAMRIQRIDQAMANALLQKMIAAGYRSPVDDLGEI